MLVRFLNVLDDDLSVEIDACSPLLLLADPFSMLPSQQAELQLATCIVDVSADHHSEI